MKILRKWMDETAVFCRGNYLLCTSLFFMMFLLYGKHAFTADSLYDTDDVIYSRGSVLNWLEIGRQGNVFTKKVFGLLWYNPYFAGALCLVLFPLTVMLLCRLFHMAGLKKSRAALWIFSFVFFACPVWAYQFYFMVQWFEIVWALFLMVVTAVMIQMMFSEKDWYREGRKYKAGVFLLETLLLVWVFSSYQAFVPMFIALCAGIYLISLSSDERGFDSREYLLRLGWMAGVFTAAFVLNTAVTRRFFMSGDYIAGQVVWGVWEVRDILYHLAAYFVKSHIGAGIQFSWLMGAGACLTAWIVYRKIRIKGKSGLYKALYVLSAATVWLAAHLLVLYTGAVPVIRSQLVYPFAMAFLLMFCMEQLAGCGQEIIPSITARQRMRLVLAFLAAAGVWGQLGSTFRLHYTEDIKDKMDMDVVQRVIDQVDRLGFGAEPQMPVVFVGDYSPRMNRAGVDTNADLSIGVSCWERVNEQPNRLIRMIENQFGVSYIRADGDTIIRAREISRDMPAYPTEGYVQEREGILIIKMSDAY